MLLVHYVQKTKRVPEQYQVIPRTRFSDYEMLRIWSTPCSNLRQQKLYACNATFACISCSHCDGACIFLAGSRLSVVQQRGI